MAGVRVTWDEAAKKARKRYRAEQKAARILAEQVQAKKEWDARQKVLKKEAAAQEKARAARKKKKRDAIREAKLALGKERLFARLAPKKKRGPGKPEKKPRKRESYADRVARLMGKGYTRAEARGHARKKAGELGVKFGRVVDSAVRAAKGDAEREVVRRMILERAGIRHFEAEREFHGRSYKQDGVKGPKSWHARRKEFEGIAATFERLFGTSQNETFSLLFSP